MQHTFTKNISQVQNLSWRNHYDIHLDMKLDYTKRSFDKKEPIPPSSERNSCIMFKVYAFTLYVSLNHVPHCNAYYAYITLYEHLIEEFGLPEILVTDNCTEFINYEIISLCRL